jgi:hypothetical protein
MKKNPKNYFLEKKWKDLQNKNPILKKKKKKKNDTRRSEVAAGEEHVVKLKRESSRVRGPHVWTTTA